MTAPTMAPGLVRPAPFSANSSVRRICISSLMNQKGRGTQEAQEAQGSCASCASCVPSSCRKKGLDEIIGRKFDQIIHLFADTDEADGYLELFRDSRNNTAFCGSIELGQYKTCNTGTLCKLLRLREAVLSSRCVQD